MMPPLVSPAFLPLSESGSAAGTLAVVDCRFQLDDREAGRRAYDMGHVPGAVYVDLERDLSGPIVPGVTGRHPLPEPEALAEKLRSWGINQASHVVAYDEQTGAMAARFWWLLNWLGHERVSVCDGGYQAWLATGGEPTRVSPRRPPGDFVARQRPELVVSADEVALLLEQPGFVLLDARSRERFRGEIEPIDRVPGHIPGAVCCPFSEALEAGRFRPKAQLASHFEAVIGATPAERVVAYCGSGVTACHTILAAQHAGLGVFRLYPGSYSEWLTDPDRPVATGD